jgi:tetratricopeptide (TPR) repeat protein
MFDLILVIVSCVSLAGIFYIVLSKFLQLASIRLDIIPSEQQLKIRNRIIANRLKSKFLNRKTTVLKKIRPFWLNFTSWFWKLYSKILEKERHLQQMSMSPEQREIAKTRVAKLLGQARMANKENKFIRAERLYINIISLDPKNLDAYDGLAKMYWQQKDYQKANETLKYVLNLAKQKRNKNIKEEKETTEIDNRLARYYLELGELCQYQGKNDDAWQNFLEATKMDENNPKALNQLLEMSIIMKKIDFAKEILEKVKGINSENQKIDYWEKRIEEFEDLG